MKGVQIDVRSGRGSYAVLVGTGLVTRLDRILPAHGVPTPSIVVSVSPVWRRHGAKLAALPAAGRPVLMPDGERAKTLGTVAKLLDICADRQLDRQSTLMAFGGGVVGDAAGFAAATYLRGVPVIQVPTTLLAQVDSSVGGKVGVNLDAGKNLVGAFHPPALVVCDPDLLRTLPAREFQAGLYEVVKYGVIASASLFAGLERNLDAVIAQDAAVLTEMITACCRIKARVVGRDEREAGLRRILNFGHTVGHALEAVTGYKRFRHGEAVAHGMLAAARLSVDRRALSANAGARLSRLIGRIGRLPPVEDLRAADVLDAIRHDKKMVKGRLHFVLATRIGATSIADDLRSQDLTRALRSIGLRA